MWKRLIELGGKLFSLVQRVTRLEESVAALRTETRDLNERVDELAGILQGIAFEMVREREKAERDREIQRLRLENALLRFERRLPPMEPESRDNEPR